jgi:type I restriction enzyme S subunit
MGVRKEGGIVPMEERLVAGDISRYKVVRSNWFAYNPMRLNIGSIARWQGGAEILVSPDYVVFRCSARAEPTALIPEYLDHFRSSRQWEAFTNESGDGGVRIRVYYRDLARMRLRLPGANEQQKIADCLSSVDALIAAEADKLEALNDYKRGLLQQLFPAPGEAIPRIRFPRFRGAGRWEQRSLQQLGVLVAGLTYRPSDVRTEGLLVLRSSNIQNGRIDLADCVFVDPNVKGANISQKDDILICVRNGSAALIGKNAMIPDNLPYCTHGAFMAIFRSNYAKFVFQLFQTSIYHKQVAADLGATINSINSAQLLKYKFRVPAEAEQREIADCLSTVDKLVEAQRAKLEALYAHKSGLMQHLFPVSEQVLA